MKNNEHTLYAFGVYGIRVWKIWSEGNVIWIEANGTRFTEVISVGLAGRTLEQQIELRINSRVRNKLDHGFVYDRDQVSNRPVNQLGTYIPMTAERLDKQKNFVYDKNGVWVQPKLDGHRTLMNPDITYTRRGKEVKTLRDIEKSQKIPYGMTTDGEVYSHGIPLQLIGSWAKRQQSDTAKLCYWVYDLIVEDEPDMNFTDRYNLLKQIIKPTDRIVITPTIKVYNPEETRQKFIECRNEGYEGLMLRPEDEKYTIGKRSKRLLKVKHYEDDEFKVIGVHLSKRSQRPVLECITKDGKEFGATAPGDRYRKMEVYNNQEKYIGRYVTCEFANYTLEGKPFQPIAVRWREDI